jgi:hypothetical protein
VRLNQLLFSMELIVLQRDDIWFSRGLNEVCLEWFGLSVLLMTKNWSIGSF